MKSSMHILHVGFQVLTAVIMRSTVFCDITNVLLENAVYKFKAEE
jgi:hypothetical protein